MAFWALLVIAGALPTAAQSSTVTYNRDIAPILYAHCISCHRPGEAGPFSLLTYQDARKHARQIAAVTKSRYMPPWLPEHGYGDFAGEQRLTNAQIKAIGDWVAAGSPQGSGTAPAPPHYTEGWQLGTPDLVITAPKPYTVPADGKDTFWNFVLSPSITATRWVRAIEIRPGNRRLVHHANLLVDRTRSCRLRERTPGAGFPGMDLTIEADTFDPDSHFLFWKPGSAPQVEPDGMAWRLDPGNDLVLNVHLQPSGKPEQVQPSVGLYFTDKPQTKFPMLIQLEHDGALHIPAGDAHFVVSDSFTLPLDADVLAVYPHAHYLGNVLEGYATLPDGSRKWLIRIPNWNLNWQAVYRYRNPVFLPKGTVISMRYEYDNSAANPRNPFHPPRLVVGGNQSTDEMGHLWLQLLPRGGKDERMVLQEALMKHRLAKYPGDFTACFNLGALRLRHQDINGAIEWLKKAVEARPNQPVALNELGAALEIASRDEEAIAYFRRALMAQPGYTNARYNLANALADTGRLDEAIPQFEAVVAADPEDSKAREHLAIAKQMLAEKQGRKSQ
ncbi:MAG TPA: tetratricopeptide repeat protein [Bryobacteraceae bacterium]|nr:tetratricopeptide repeat protein [Bryobacteraceae bacterium]